MTLNNTRNFVNEYEFIGMRKTLMLMRQQLTSNTYKHTNTHTELCLFWMFVSIYK